MRLTGKMVAIAVAIALVLSMFAMLAAISDLGGKKSSDQGASEEEDCKWSEGGHEHCKENCCTCGQHPECPNADDPEPEPCPAPDPSEPGTVISSLVAI